MNLRDLSCKLCKEERGAVTVVFTLLMLVMLAILGFTATETTNTELAIVRNDHFYKRNFYFSESAGMEAAEQLEDAGSGDLYPDTTSFSWLKTDAVDFTDTSQWAGNSQSSSNQMLNPPLQPPTTSYAAVARGVAPGSSMDMAAASRLYAFSIYGYHNAADGQALIEMGYRKRF